jgi:hypothetical protein
MSASKAQRALTAARRKQAIALKLAGLTYEQIADRLEYSSRQAAQKDLVRALATALTDLGRTAEEFRELELQRLDRLQAAAWPLAMNGNLHAINTCRQIINDRRQLLGLDAPQRHEVLTVDALDAAIQQLEAELGGMPPVPAES